MVSSVNINNSQQVLPSTQSSQNLLIDPVQVSGSNVPLSASTMTHRTGENRLENIDPTSPEYCVKQPEKRPISQEQLVAEVKRIYAGLIMVESKCIEVINKQKELGDDAPKLNNEQFQALTVLHRTLLHEHHDFILASQHPSASPALKRLPEKYTMPQRMIQHAVIDPIKFFDKKDDSKEHYLTMLHTAHGICALLSETVNTQIKEQYVPIRDQLAAHIKRASDSF